MERCVVGLVKAFSSRSNNSSQFGEFFLNKMQFQDVDISDSLFNLGCYGIQQDQCLPLAHRRRPFVPL